MLKSMKEGFCRRKHVIQMIRAGLYDAAFQPKLLFWWQCSLKKECKEVNVHHFHYMVIQSHAFHTKSTPEARKFRKGGRKNCRSFEEVLMETERLVSYIRNIRRQVSENQLLKQSPIRSDDYFHNLEAWMELAKYGHGITAAKQAQVLLDTLEHARYETPAIAVFHPRTSFYDVVLQAYAVCGGQSEAARACQNILERMIKKCLEHANGTIGLTIPPQPTTKTFNIAINAWAKSGHKDAGYFAEDVFKLLEKWNNECEIPNQHPSRRYSKCLPNERTMVSLIDAWARSLHPTAPERASQLLDEVLQSKLPQDPAIKIASEKYRHVKLNVAAFNSVLHAWALSNRGREAAMKAEEILRLLIGLNDKGSLKDVKPNTRTYSTIVDVWAKCESIEGFGDAAERAERILLDMIHLHRNGVDIKPNNITFTTCIAAWSRCQGRPDAPDRAEHLLDFLIQLYKETNDDDFKPLTATGNAVISSWAKAATRPDSTQHALAVLEKIKLYSKPDIVSFNAVLDSMGKQGYGEQAIDLLGWLETKSREGSRELQPNLITYNSTLSALARSQHPSAAEQAEQLLKNMENLSFFGAQKVRPDRFSYTIVLDAWSRSSSTQKASRAWSLVREMMLRYESGDIDVKPDVFFFTVLMKCCSNVSGSAKDRKDALKISCDAMNALEYHGYGPPNHIAFSTYMVAVDRLCEDQTDKKYLLESAFRRCAETGYVSKQVIAALVRSTGTTIESQCLKKAWSNNVPERDAPTHRF